MQPLTSMNANRRRLAAVAVAGLMAAICAGAVALRAETNAQESAALSYANDLSSAFRTAADKVLPSVVMITNKPANVMPADHPDPGIDKLPFGDMFRDHDLKRFFREMPSVPAPPQGGIGSGVIVDESGVILTNDHVVAGGGTVTVRLQDGREFEAIEVKTDPKTDLAVVRIEADNLKAVPMGDSDQMQIGDWVLALGQPFGLEGTVTAGIISAKGRGIGLNDRESYLQTDAAINPGNSGGPLVNLDGEVIGINTAISSRSGGSEGIGFAVPINVAKWVSEQLRHDGTVHRGQLGVSIQSLTHQLAEQFGLKPGDGVLVNDVLADSPAAQAGVKTGDVIVEFAGKKISEPRELQFAVEETKPGSEQQLVVVRGGERLTLTAAIREVAGGNDASGKAGTAGDDEFSLQKYGFGIGALSAELAEQMGMKDARGVAITSVEEGTPAGEAGLKAGMLVTEVNRKPVTSVEEFRQAIEKESAEKGMLLLVRTSEGSRFVALLPKA